MDLVEIRDQMPHRVLVNIPNEPDFDIVLDGVRFGVIETRSVG